MPPTGPDGRTGYRCGFATPERLREGRLEVRHRRHHVAGGRHADRRDLLLHDPIELVLDQRTDLHVAWWILALAGGALIWAPAVLGIRLSIRADLALLLVEGAVLGALGLTILLNGGADGAWPPSVFDPGNAPDGASGIALAAVFDVLSFTGSTAWATTRPIRRRGARWRDGSGRPTPR